MKYAWKLSLAVVALALAACDSSNDDSPLVAVPAEPVPTFDVQVLHASPDAPAVDVLVDGSAALTGVDYKVGSGRTELDEGTYNIAVEALLPGGNTPVIGPVDLGFSGDMIYTIAAVGDVSAIEPVVLEQPRTPVTAGTARLFVLHASSAAPQVDVYVTPPGADLAASAPVGTFSFKETIGPAEVTAGDFQIRVTVAGDPSAVVYDSGTVALADGTDLFVAAVPNTSGGTAAVSLVALNGAASLEILDKDTPASLRVFHKSPDAPAVDIIVNDDFANPLVSGLAFPEFAGYVGVPAGDYNVKVTAAGNPGAIVIDADLALAAGEVYDVLAVDNLGAIDALVLNDDPRTVNTFAKVRIVHASPTAQDVDIYVAEPGTDITTIDPAFSAVAFKASTGYVELPAGDYEVTVVPAGTTTAAIGPATFMFANGDVYTVVARDAVGGGTPLNVVVTPDSIDD